METRAFQSTIKVEPNRSWVRLSGFLCLIAVAGALYFTYLAPDSNGEHVNTAIESIREIGKLSLYEVRNADLYKGSYPATKNQREISIQYIVYSAAQICMDFEKIEINCKNDSPHCYVIRLPELTVDRARILHDGDKSTRVWKTDVPSKTSVLDLDKKLKEKVEEEIKEKAKDPERRRKALKQAKDIIEAMIRAGDKDATFDYL